MSSTKKLSNLPPKFLGKRKSKQESRNRKGAKPVVEQDVTTIAEDLKKAFEEYLAGADDSDESNFEQWKKDVLAKYPQYASRIKFLGKDGKHVSAQVPGQDRSFGVWDMDSQRGEVLTEGAEDEDSKDGFACGYTGDEACKCPFPKGSGDAIEWQWMYEAGQRMREENDAARNDGERKVVVDEDMPAAPAPQPGSTAPVAPTGSVTGGQPAPQAPTATTPVAGQQPQSQQTPAEQMKQLMATLANNPPAAKQLATATKNMPLK